jgi:hypothetical protein
MDSSHNSEECDALYKTERLDALEKGLYEQVKFENILSYVVE